MKDSMAEKKHLHIVIDGLNKNMAIFVQLTYLQKGKWFHTEVLGRSTSHQSHPTKFDSIVKNLSWKSLRQ